MDIKKEEDQKTFRRYDNDKLAIINLQTWTGKNGEPDIQQQDK